MKAKRYLATLLTILASTGPLLSQTEVERLRLLCAEQEMQIAQLEQKIERMMSQQIDQSAPQPLPKPVSQTLPKATTKPAPVAEAPAPSQSAQKDVTYTVKPGDSLQRIANRNKMSLKALAKLNNLKPDAIIHPNQKLVVGKTASPEATVENRPSSSKEKYTIKSGDTLYKISRLFDVTVSELLEINPGIKPNTLRVGDQINVISSTQAKQTNVSKNTATASLSTGSSQTILNSPSPTPAASYPVGPIKINTEITYGEFAKNHYTTTERLDELNGLSLDSDTVLAKGSELYIPAQP